VEVWLNILTSVLYGGGWSSSQLGCCTWYPLNRQLGVPWGWSGSDNEEKNPCPARN